MSQCSNILFELSKIPFECLDSYLEAAHKLTKIGKSSIIIASELAEELIQVGASTSRGCFELSYEELFVNGQNTKPYFICRRVI